MAWSAKAYLSVCSDVSSFITARFCSKNERTPFQVVVGSYKHGKKIISHGSNISCVNFKRVRVRSAVMDERVDSFRCCFEEFCLSKRYFPFVSYIKFDKVERRHIAHLACADVRGKIFLVLRDSCKMVWMEVQVRSANRSWIRHQRIMEKFICCRSNHVFLFCFSHCIHLEILTRFNGLKHC